MGEPAFAVEQQSAELFLERLDGAGKGGLRYIAFGGPAREVQLLGKRKEIADLMHFHGRDAPTQVSPHPSKDAGLPKNKKRNGGLPRRLLTRILPSRRLVDGGSDRSNHLRSHL